MAKHHRAAQYVSSEHTVGGKEVYEDKQDRLKTLGKCKHIRLHMHS